MAKQEANIKAIKHSVSEQVLAATALGAGIFVGATTAYLATRIHEHSKLALLVTHLHSTVREVKEEIANLENELGLLHHLEDFPGEKTPRKRHRKTVSFSSTTSNTYLTCSEAVNSGVLHHTTSDTATDAESYVTTSAYDTEYFSPDEDEDEFFDILQTDDESEVISSSQANGSSCDILNDVSRLSLLLRTVDNLIDKSPEEQIQAYHLLQEKGHKYEDNAELLWRKAKATRNLAAIEDIKGNLKEKQNLINKAYTYAVEALQINNKSAEVHKWYAILAGARGEFLSLKERIASGHVFKEHIDLALQISPNDSTLHHLLGRFCFEVSLLTWVERKVASALFGEIASSSFEEALNHFLLAEELKSDGWKENRLFIAKCYLKLSNYPESERWLKQALDLPSLTVDDEIVNKEVDQLIQRHSMNL